MDIQYGKNIALLYILLDITKSICISLRADKLFTLYKYNGRIENTIHILEM